MASSIERTPVTTPWRDVLQLDVKDPVLRQKVEGFLDTFEHSIYHSDLVDPADGKVKPVTLSGAAMLDNMKETLNLYKENSGQYNVLKNRDIRAELQKLGIAFSDDKFVISSHEREMNGVLQNGTFTVLVGQDGTLPIAIQLGEKYLRGAQYLGTDGKYHPVSVDGVLANELAHVAFTTSNEELSNVVENAVITPKGAQERNPKVESVHYTPESNGGYLTLYDKAPGEFGSRGIFPTLIKADPVKADPENMGQLTPAVPPALRANGDKVQGPNL